MKYIGAYIIGYMFILVGLAVSIYGLIQIWNAWGSISWIAAEGEVTESTIKSTRDSDGTHFSPAIRYAYRVDGRDFVGTRVFLGDAYSETDTTYANKYVARYPAGAKVTVYYNPREPSSAVLQRGAFKKTYLFLTFGIGFASFAAWFCVQVWMSTHPDPNGASVVSKPGATKKSSFPLVFGIGIVSIAVWFFLMAWMCLE